MVFSVGPCRILPYSQISCIFSSMPATQPCWDLTSLKGLTGELCFRCHCSWAVYLSPSSCLACQPCPGSRMQEFRLPLSEGWASPWLAVLLCSCGQDMSTRKGSTAVWDKGVWHHVRVGYCRDSASQTVFSHMWSGACLLAHTLLWFLISELHYVLFFAHCNLSLPNCEAWEGSTLNCAQWEKGAGNRGKSQSQKEFYPDVSGVELVFSFCVWLQRSALLSQWQGDGCSVSSLYTSLLPLSCSSVGSTKQRFLSHLYHLIALRFSKALLLGMVVVVFWCFGVWFSLFLLRLQFAPPCKELIFILQFPKLSCLLVCTVSYSTSPFQVCFLVAQIREGKGKEGMEAVVLIAVIIAFCTQQWTRCDFWRDLYTSFEATEGVYSYPQGTYAYSLTLMEVASIEQKIDQAVVKNMKI